MGFRDMHSQTARFKIRREFLSAYNVAKATETLREELGRLETSLKCDDVEGQIEALGDIIVYCLGGLETFGCNTERILQRIASDNKAGPRPIEGFNYRKAAERIVISLQNRCSI